MQTYYPALRFKQGEYIAGARIASDIRRHVEPRFIIPPPKENDPEKGRPLTVDEVAYLTGERIGKFWPLHRAFLDAHYIAPYLGADGLKRMLGTAQRRNSELVVVATLGDLSNPIYRNFLRSSSPRIGIYLPYEEVDAGALLTAVRGIGCEPEECILFLDFTGAPLDVVGVSGSVAGLFDILGTTARWGRIVFQGSSFPTSNPAAASGEFLVPRHEWSVFHEAVKECSVPPELLGFGDYGADCGEINFPRKGGGGRAIRHLRYTGESDIVVIRGASSGKDAVIMSDVCQRVLDSGHYAGQSYSYADDRIWRTAKGAEGSGNASNWREWNMAHHMTRVVRDLGAMSGVSFADVVATALAEQTDLFEKV